MNLGTFAPPDTWRHCFQILRHPQTRLGDRLSDTIGDLEHELDGEPDAYRRAQLLEQWAAVTSQLANLTRYGLDDEDLRMLHLETAIVTAASLSEIAIATGERQPVDVKLPGGMLWLQLQDEPNRADRPYLRRAR